MAESATAPSGSSPAPSAPSAGSSQPSGGQKTVERMIDQASQMTLAQKLVKPSSSAHETPAAEKTAPAGEDKGPEKATAKPVPGSPQKFKVQIDGKEQEVTLEDLQRDYQVRTVATKRLQEATDLQKKLGSVLGVIRSNTGEALKAAGLSDDQIESFAVQLIAERQRTFLEQERLKNATPEEKELHRLRQLEAEYKKQQELQVQQQRKQEFEQAKLAISQNVIATLEMLPKEYRKNDFVASRALDAWQYAYENQQALRDRGVSISPQTIARALRSEIEGLGKSLAQLAKEAVVNNEPIPELPQQQLSRPAQPGKPISRKTTDKKEDVKEPISQAQLMRQIILGQR